MRTRGVMSLVWGVAALLASSPAHAEAPVAAPNPVASVPLAGGGLCDASWVQRVYKDTRASIVRIETLDGLGTGFFFFRPNYVVTAFHVVALGRGLAVVLADGSRQGAEVVAISPESDLAILEISHPVPDMKLLEPSAEQAAVGSPVLTIGHPFALLDRFNPSLRGLLYWSATQGIVSARSEGLLQTDAAVNPGNSGGPLLGCDGRLLGVISSKLEGEAIGFAVPTARLTALTKEIGRQPIYQGGWHSESQLGLWLAEDPNVTWLGAALAFNFVVRDRWVTTFRGGVFTASTSLTDGPVVDRSGYRGQFELLESFRMLVFERPFPVYLAIGVGGALTIDRVNETRLVPAATNAACASSGSACLLRSHTTERKLWPMGTASLLLGQSLEISYGFQAELKDLGASTHRLLMGFAF